MKAFNVIVKVLAALAAVAGAVYVVATYGDQIGRMGEEDFRFPAQVPLLQGRAEGRRRDCR